MVAIQLTLISFIISANALSIGTVSENENDKNVTKREASLGDLFPDWVPFKNKHGEELGEFVQVTKAKPKKRLAPPVNFILRAVAEPEGDDYFEKGQGESDGDEYYEKKDWSDTNRPVHLENAKAHKTPDNHTDISDIDGVVSIITKPELNPVVEALKKAEQNEAQAGEVKEEEKKTETREIAEQPKEEEEKQPKPAAPGPPKHKYEDEIDYEDIPNQEKRKPEQEPVDEDQSESEAKKASILDSVDELKERHAKEQIAINEKAKEEEIYQEEREREKIQAQLSSNNGVTDKYELKAKQKKVLPDYEEYEEKESSLEEKYRSLEKLKPTTTNTPKRTPKHKGRKDKTVETGKLSVFKNPQLYIVYDDDSEETTTEIPKVLPPKSYESRNPKPKSLKEKFSSRFSGISTATNDNGRISLVPEGEGKEDEPALFFPKKRKNKKRKNNKFTPLDSSTAESVATKKSKLDIPLVDTTGSDTIVVDTTVVDTTVGSTADAISTNSDAVTDAVPASTDHKEEGKGDEDYHREKGGGRHYKSDHKEEHSEEGKKAYEGVHKETKSAKGHHEKENHIGKYDDHGGLNKHHEEETEHYGADHHEEHGKKHAKYEESGKHSKGHSTKGSHDIHKKEEYEKKVEFFEEEGDSGEEEKHGGFNEEHGHSQGGHFKNGNYKAGHAQHAKGDSGQFAKGGHLHMSKGHKVAEGHDGHGQHGSDHHSKSGKESGKKWIYHHGSPAKTANLVLIDRRGDQMYHGPQYYG